MIQGEAKRRQRKEENMDLKADKAQKHSEKLRKDKEWAMSNIKHQRNIELCEAKINENKDRIRRQQEIIRIHRQEAISLLWDADLRMYEGRNGKRDSWNE